MNKENFFLSVQSAWLLFLFFMSVELTAAFNTVQIGNDVKNALVLLLSRRRAHLAFITEKDINCKHFIDSIHQVEEISHLLFADSFYHNIHVGFCQIFSDAIVIILLACKTLNLVD